MKIEERLLIEYIKLAFFDEYQSEFALEHMDGCNLEKLWKLSANHSLCPLVSSVYVDKLNIDGDLKKFFVGEIYKAMCEDEKKSYEFQKLCDCFVKNKINHIPLKGLIIKKMYPHTWQRTSCDIDILVKKEDLNNVIRILTDELEYIEEKKADHDVSLTSPSGITVEIHHKLFESYVFENKNIPDVWESAYMSEENQGTYFLSDDMFYLYHIIHMAKHFKYGGFGIRLLVDLMVLNNTQSPDKEERNNLVKKAGFEVFDKYVNNLIHKMFFCSNMDEKTESFLSEFVFPSGTYGLSSFEAAQNSGSLSGAGYILKRIFMPYKDLCRLYKKLEKRKYMYPYYIVCRWCNYIFLNKHKNIKKEINISKSIKKGYVKEFKKLIKALDV